MLLLLLLLLLLLFMIQSIDAYHYFDEEEHDTFAMTDNDADAAGCSRLGCAREGSPPN